MRICLEVNHIYYYIYDYFYVNPHQFALRCRSHSLSTLVWGMGVEVQLQGLDWGYRLNYEPWAGYLGQLMPFLGERFRIFASSFWFIPLSGSHSQGWLHWQSWPNLASCAHCAWSYGIGFWMFVCTGSCPETLGHWKESLGSNLPSSALEALVHSRFQKKHSKNLMFESHRIHVWYIC